MRVWTGLGCFYVRQDLTRPTARESIVITHEGPLQLEVVDPAVKIRVLSLALYDIFVKHEEYR